MEDFAKYYTSSYCKTRDGKIYYIREVVVSRSVVVVGEISADRHNFSYDLVVRSWDHIKKNMIFGKIDTGMILVNGAVYKFYLPNNRVWHRGWTPENFGFAFRGGDGDALHTLQYGISNISQNQHIQMDFVSLFLYILVLLSCEFFYIDILFHFPYKLPF